MSTTPDFDMLAEALVHDVAMVIGATRAGTDCLAARRIILTHLHQVWNARGAADLLAVRARGPWTNADDVIRKLDR